MMKLQLLLKIVVVISILLLSHLSHAATSRVTKIQSMNLGAYTRVMINLYDAHTYRVFTLANPDRLVIDLNDTRITTALKNVNFTDGNITQVRSGRPTQTVTRLVFDMNNPARFKTFLASGNSPHEAQLVVDVYAKAKRHLSPRPTITSKLKPLKVKAQKHEIKKAVLQATTASAAHKIVVAIDPGHGGKDPGTVGANHTKEKTIVLKIALHLAALINNEPNMRAVLTRSSDHFVSLRRRLDLARKNKADLFISIHADSYLDDHSEGASVYALSRHGATTEAARWLAKHENYSELGGVDFNGLSDQSYLLRSVLIDLAQTATITDSLRFGTQMLVALDKVTTLHHRQVEQAPFVVLKSPDIPSVLIETGFLSNPKEAKRLYTKEYQEVLSLALLSGIHDYVAKHPAIASNARPRLLT